MDAFQLRNFKDFLLLFNQVSERCFSRCVDNLNSRTLSPAEEQCVELCAKKFINVNHRVMGVYVEVQSALTQKRIQEVQETQEAQAIANTTPEPVSNSGSNVNEVSALPEQISNKAEVNTT